jgi:gamma-glutamylcyclotransferase (GGCT)/AIG2-like uncharacterized protein YtfP
MSDLVFFYGTLMTPFHRTARAHIDQQLEFRGRGTIAGALFDLGIYPAAIPASDARVRGEVYKMHDAALVLSALDELEGYRPDDPETSLYTRALAPVTVENGNVCDAWVYFYNAPLGRAERISSGDYLEYLKVR